MNEYFLTRARVTANSYTFYKNSNESGDTASAYISFVVFISKYAIYIVL